MNEVDRVNLASFFTTYGYAHVPRLLSEAETARLGAEVDKALAAAGATPAEPRAALTGSLRHEASLVGSGSDISTALTWSGPLVDLAASLLGRPVVPRPAKGILYPDATAFHADSADPNLRAVKLVAYLEPLTAATGALRVVPGSHHPSAAARLEEYRRVNPPGNPMDEDAEADAWSSVAAETRPGEITAFDVHLWHGSVHGRNRMQWAVAYAAMPETDDERESVCRYLGLTPAGGAGPDPRKRYDMAWLEAEHPRFAARIAELCDVAA